MKEKKILEALNEVDDDLIEKANPQKNRKRYIKWIALAACFAIISGIAISLLKSQPDENLIVDSPESESNTEFVEFEESTVEEGYTEIFLEVVDEEAWKKMSETIKFDAIKYNSITYEYQFKKVSEEEIGRKLAQTTVSSTLEPPKNADGTANITIYERKNLDSDCAIIVKFENNEDFYLYTNRYCKFETLGEIIDKLKFKEYMRISKSIYEKDDTCLLKYKPIDEKIIWNMLLDDTSLEIVENKKIKADFSVYFVNTAIYDISYEFNYFDISKDGYLSVHILDNDYVFFIGEKKAKSFIEHVVENYEGKTYYYTTYPDSSPGLDMDDDYEEILTEVISNGYKP